MSGRRVSAGHEPAGPISQCDQREKGPPAAAGRRVSVRGLQAARVAAPDGRDSGTVRRQQHHGSRHYREYQHPPGPGPDR